MSKEVLEKALKKTNELEEKEMKKMKLAERIGWVTGIAIATALETTLVWAVVKFVIGAVAFSWLSALGTVILANLVCSKLKSK